MAVSADRVFASLAGSAVGDALGLPYENLSARRAARLLGGPDRFRFALGRGMVSDDAEHACMTAAAFAVAAGDVDRFRRDLARRLRWWLLTIPPGIGLATLKSIGRLWLGVPPTRSGVRSAGNGPAMRAAILGRLGDREHLYAFIAASSELTHRDPRATLGSFAVAMASRVFGVLLPTQPDVPGLDLLRATINALRADVPANVDASELFTLLDRVADSVARGESTATFAPSVCRRPGRVSGYVYETVPVALHAAFAHADAMDAVRAAIRCGGDADSVASIVGGIRGIDDAAMLGRLIEWPCDAEWLRRRAEAAIAQTVPPRLPWASRGPRNALQLAIVLAHVGRRALPPY